MDSNSKIYIAGHKGLVGTALTRQLKAQGYDNIITSGGLDLRDQDDVNTWFNARVCVSSRRKSWWHWF